MFDDENEEELELIQGLGDLFSGDVDSSDGAQREPYQLIHPTLGLIGVLKVGFAGEPAHIRCHVAPEVKRLKERELSGHLSAQLEQQASRLLTRCDVPERVVRVRVCCNDLSRVATLELETLNADVMIVLDCDRPYRQDTLSRYHESLSTLLKRQLPVLKADERVYFTPRLISQTRCVFVCSPEQLKALKSLARMRKSKESVSIPLAIVDFTRLGGELFPLRKLYEALYSRERRRSDLFSNQELLELIMNDIMSLGQRVQHYYGESWQHQQAVGLTLQLLGPLEVYNTIKETQPSLPTLLTITRLNSLAFYGYHDGSPRSDQLSLSYLEGMMRLYQLTFAQATLFREELCLGLRALIAKSLFEASSRLGLKAFLSIFCQQELSRLDKDVRRKIRDVRRSCDQSERSPFDQLVMALPDPNARRAERRSHNLPAQSSSLISSLTKLDSLASLIVAQGLLVLETAQPLLMEGAGVSSDKRRGEVRGRSGMSLREALRERQMQRHHSHRPRALQSQHLNESERDYRGHLFNWVGGLFNYASPGELLRGLSSLSHALFHLQWESLTVELLTLTQKAQAAYTEHYHALQASDQLSLLSPSEPSETQMKRIKLRLKAWSSLKTLGHVFGDPLVVGKAKTEDFFLRFLRLYHLSEVLERSPQESLQTIINYVRSRSVEPANDTHPAELGSEHS